MVRYKAKNVTPTLTQLRWRPSLTFYCYQKDSFIFIQQVTGNSPDKVQIELHKTGKSRREKCPGVKDIAEMEGENVKHDENGPEK